MSNSVSQDMLSETPPFPRMVVLTMVYPCNASCPHCPYNNATIREEYRDQPFMDEGVFRKVAQEAGKHGVLLRISGAGEPMMHPKVTELLVYAKSMGCKIGLITNGSLFTEENSRALLEAGVDMIEFSVDAADPDTYHVVRKRLKWDILLENARRMLAIRNAIKSTSNIVASGVNQVGIDIDEVERFWRNDVGVDNFIRRKFLTWGENTKLDASQSADPAPYLDINTEPCPFIFERVLIDTRGTVMGCPYDIGARFVVGDLKKSSLAEIWHCEAFRDYRRQHLALQGHKIEMCSKCPDWKYRSWDHNYWKVMRDASAVRSQINQGGGNADKSDHRA
ncbi:MAG: radical SAM protein [Alphaproteobacteria bacterium]|nr:radical SAM protein [Alphaproteobacteria bacterium]